MRRGTSGPMYITSLSFHYKPYYLCTLWGVRWELSFYQFDPQRNSNQLIKELTCSLDCSMDVLSTCWTWLMIHCHFARVWTQKLLHYYKNKRICDTHQDANRGTWWRSGIWPTTHPLYPTFETFWHSILHQIDQLLWSSNIYADGSIAELLQSPLCFIQTLKVASAS